MVWPTLGSRTAKEQNRTEQTEYCGRSVRHDCDPCKNRSTDRHVVWVMDSGGPNLICVTYRKVHGTSAVSCEKRLNRSRCRLGHGLGPLGLAQGSMLDGVHIGAAGRIRLNDESSCVAAIRTSLPDYFDHLMPHEPLLSPMSECRSPFRRLSDFKRCILKNVHGTLSNETLCSP